MINIDFLLKSLQKELDIQTYGTHPVELYDPVQYIMSLGGKRFRPLLTLISTYLYTDDWSIAIKPAMAVEVFHNFTLMHDDIMDNAPLRRGMPTVHEKWNANTAILSGDVMLIKAYDLLIEAESPALRQAIKRFNTTAAEVCEGQQIDMNFESRSEVTEEEYLEMIRLKTSVLLGFALELGGMLGGASEIAQKSLYAAGENMGLGFQLKDDLLDVYGDPVKFGKQVGGDIISNKKTFLLIEALTKADSKTKLELNKWLALREFDSNEKVNAVRNIYCDLGLKQITELKIQKHFDIGLNNLKSLHASTERKNLLLNFVHQLVNREQ